MGTRAIAFVYDYDEPVVALYSQYDGYPSGYGLDIAKFLDGMTLVNGLSINDSGKKIANGFGCLGAQLVVNFKTDAGGFYLYPPKADVDAGQEYEYHIYENEVIVKDYDHKILFNGSWQEFLKFCENAE